LGRHDVPGASPGPHDLTAHEDSVVLLTVAKAVGNPA